LDGSTVPFTSEKTGHRQTATGHDPDINYLSACASGMRLTHCQKKEKLAFLADERPDEKRRTGHDRTWKLGGIWVRFQLI
jgi:hypothetical protein